MGASACHIVAVLRRLGNVWIALVAVSCVASSGDGETADGAFTDASGAWRQGRDSDQHALRTALRDAPRWTLYRANPHVILAVPDGAPRAQWLLLPESDIRTRGAERYFSELVEHGRLSVLDLIALRDTARTIDDLDALPPAASMLEEPQRHVCLECGATTPAPDTPSTAGIGGPVLPSSPHPTPQSGGVHYGPGWVASDHPAPRPPTPAPPDPDHRLSFAARLRRGLEQAALKLLKDKHTCYEACLAAPTVTGYGAYVCADPWMRAVPQTGMPCAIVTGAAAVSALAAPWCAIWCDEVFDAVKERG